jgi:hypothetical protein
MRRRREERQVLDPKPLESLEETIEAPPDVAWKATPGQFVRLRHKLRSSATR